MRRPNQPRPRVATDEDARWLAAAACLAERARPGDLVITLGAGDITGVGPQVLDLLGGA